MSATQPDRLDEDEPADDDPRIAAALDEYLAASAAGRPVNRRDFLARHPHIATELSQCLDGLNFIQAAAAEIPGAPPAPKRRPDVDPSMAQPLGDFQLVQEIGHGGMGTVYEAIQLSLGRRVAVKVLPMAAALDTRHLERFHLEAQAAARLHHGNIVPVYAVGCERSVHFYAMQLIDGASLDEVISDLRWLAKKEIGVEDRASEKTSQNLSKLRSSGGSAYAQSVARLAVQAAEALEYAHDAGVVHRDIKPANLLLDSAGKLWITDFGLAQFYAESGLTRSGDFVGTLRYMSPEQASGRAVVLDQRTDIYSLGVTIYELLTLERALGGTTHAQLLRELAEDQPRSPRSIDRTIPPELDTIITKAIAKDPADRYPTAGALADDLRRFLRDEPILARPPSLRDKAVKWVRRHKSLAASSFLVLTLAALGFSLSTFIIAREQAQTRIALELQKQKAIEAQQQRARAERSGKLAREAVEFFAQIASDEMDRPGFADVRREMLEESLVYFQNFLEERAPTTSTSEELDAARARVTRSLGLFSSLDALMQANRRIRLLSEPSVRSDLSLTSPQSQKAQLLLEETDSRPPPGNRHGTPEDRTKENVASAKEMDTSISNAIGLRKADRLRQIQRQVRGALAFTESEVESRLALSREQLARIRGIILQLRNNRIRPEPGEDPGDSPQPAHDGVASVLAILTPGQIQTWKELVGLPFIGTVRRDSPDDSPGPPPRPRQQPDDPPPQGE